MDTGGPPPEENSEQSSNDASRKDQTKNEFPSEYSFKHYGPYKIFIQRKEVEINPATGKPKAISRIHFAKDFVPLFDSGIKSINQAGFSKLSVICKNRQTANALLKHPLLAEKGYMAFIPYSCVSKQVILKGVPTDVSDEVLG